MNEYQEKENVAICAIDDRLQKVLNREMTLCSPDFSSEFLEWNCCIKRFTQLFSSLAPQSFDWSKCKDCYIHGSDFTQRFTGNFMKRKIKDVYQKNPYIYTLDSAVSAPKRYKELHVFFESKDVDSFIKSKRLSKPDIDWGDIVWGFSCGVNRKFTHIEFTKFDFLDDGVEPASVILGGFKTDYLEQMLDVSDHKVSTLLPYLLSAYVYNYKSNSIVRRSDILDYIFNSDAEVSTSERARVQTQLYKLAL